MKKIKVAVFGTGWMGQVHIEALRRLGNIDVVGVAAATAERARKFADDVFVERSTGDYHELLADPEIQVVHVCSTNDQHYAQTMAALAAGKHVLCEKPLASSVEEGRQMLALAQEKGLAHGTMYNVRSYPQVQQMRQMCLAGEFGDIQFIQGTYSQDWLLYDTDWNWRIDAGKSRTFADIGTHWCDLAEHVTGQKITSVCSMLETFLKTRKRPKVQVATFQGKELKPDDYTEMPISTEDFGAMIFQMGETTRGSMTASQVSAGRKNRVYLEVNGTKCSAAWDGERPDELWIGHRNERSEVLLKDPSLLSAKARSFADFPGGHSEGYDDTFKQTFKRFYRTVVDRSAPVEHPTFADGIRQLQILDGVLASSKQRSWVDIA